MSGEGQQSYKEYTLVLVAILQSKVAICSSGGLSEHHPLITCFKATIFNNWRLLTKPTDNTCKFYDHSDVLKELDEVSSIQWSWP